MNKSLKIMLLTAVMVFIGACDLNRSIDIPATKVAHCKRYHKSYYDAETKVCHTTVDKPVNLNKPFNTPEIDDALSEIFKSPRGGKPKCKVNGEQFLKPITEPFLLRVTATCDDLDLDITFTDSINEFSQKALDNAEKDAKICSRYQNAHACEYKYLDKYCMRDWTKPLECKIEVLKPVKYPDNSKNLSEIFNENCEVSGWKLLDLNDRTKQQVFAICNDTQVDIIFKHVMTEKEILYEKCQNKCKQTSGEFPAVSFEDFNGTCICEEENDEYDAKLDNIKTKNLAMLQSMINIKNY